MYWIDRIVIATIAFAVLVYVLWATPRYLDPTGSDPVKQERDRRWVNTSPYFVDRQACRWLTLCGLHHLRADPANREYRNRKHGQHARPPPTPDVGRGDGGKPAGSPHRRDIPDYVFKHAPLVHLYSGEQFWPSDMRDHITHMDIQLNSSLLDDAAPWDLGNMSRLNSLDGSVFLHSKNDVESRPPWLHSRYNVPSASFPAHATHTASDEPAALDETLYSTTTTPHHPHTKPSNYGQSRAVHAPPLPQKVLAGAEHKQQQMQAAAAAAQGYKPDAQGYSGAPAVLVLVDKEDGVLDAFWFFFYSYNLGQTVLTMRFGNHIADWEHCMVRFKDGVPQGMYLSEHEGGQAYAWEAMEKRNVTWNSAVAERPVIYSATGSHAMYATPGDHAYILPFKMLKDVTDKGPLWDPSLNHYAYFYDYESDDDFYPDNAAAHTGAGAAPGSSEGSSLTPAASNPDAPTSWFHFRGRWGDGVYPLADVRQWRLFGQYHYVSGPQGPKFKNLGRKKMCLAKKCRIRHERDGSGTWY
ncbi:Vacuolar protein sorting-associated protein 62 [Cordyceps fumosorosea ARSEF 2679]|uniref:Vacuolar protein sorting-associated protein 62 n=1 Tax=Cordyceps fumosorosea (strain ARSEF 2679) TaxID=1081104 RepID=A0A167XCC0_CORFA|nr:Vacuolar protein sorting-associated protein 62 [Cordyceps fumosorosea ARSEF 2679]OAA64797.1 Vacuolar protein sorting-associated protein 62 [Cordyceps fumosorosea ARSEF 2679]